MFIANIAHSEGLQVVRGELCLSGVLNLDLVVNLITCFEVSSLPRKFLLLGLRVPMCERRSGIKGRLGGDFKAGEAIQLLLERDRLS